MFGLWHWQRLMVGFGHGGGRHRVSIYVRPQSEVFKGGALDVVVNHRLSARNSLALNDFRHSKQQNAILSLLGSALWGGEWLLRIFVFLVNILGLYGVVISDVVFDFSLLRHLVHWR